MRRMPQHVKTSIVAALGLLLILPSAAPAASTAPNPSTGAAVSVTFQSATLTGSVDPNGAVTTYLFQYGTTTIYGMSTPLQGAGAGTSPAAVAASVTGLAPATTYHYRLVAHNRNGTVNGSDRRFRTPPQPLGATLAAAPNPVALGHGTVLGGMLVGTGSAGHAIVLQASPFPFAQGFANVGNPQITDAQGAFAFSVLSVPINTQYRVIVPDKPAVTSPIVTVGVAVRVSTHVSARHVFAGQRVRFHGTVRPGGHRVQIAIQKRRNKRWVTVAGTRGRRGTARLVHYSKRVRIRRGGRYRVFARAVDGAYAPGVGRTVRIRRR